MKPKITTLLSTTQLIWISMYTTLVTKLATRMGHFKRDLIGPAITEIINISYCFNRKVVKSFWDSGVRKVSKFYNFWANLFEFRSEKSPFLFVPH